jgi:hypothetical protein
MYIARYGNQLEAVDQALVRLPLVCLASARGAHPWRSRWATAVSAAIDTPAVDISWRITVANRRVDRQLLMSVPHSDEAALTRICDAMAASNAIVTGSVDLCADRSEHDNSRGDFPPSRGWLRGLCHEFGSASAMSDFRITQELNALLAQAFIFGWDFALQLNIRRLGEEDRLGILREMRKNLVRLRTERSVPAFLIAVQEAMAARLETAAYLVDEYLGGASLEVLDSVVAWLGGRSKSRTGQFSSGFEIESCEDLDVPIVTGFHRYYFGDLEPRGAAPQSLSDRELRDLLCWEPAADLLPYIENVVADAEDDVLQRLERQLDRIEAAVGGRRGSAAACNEMRKAIEIHRADPPFALAKARSILEEIITRLYRENRPGAPVKPLFNMIEELIGGGTVFPKNIATYLHAVRVIGNLVVHQGATSSPPVTVQDVEIGLLMILCVIEWYLFRTPATA